MEIPHLLDAAQHSRSGGELKGEEESKCDSPCYRNGNEGLENNKRTQKEEPGSGEESGQRKSALLRKKNSCFQRITRPKATASP